MYIAAVTYSLGRWLNCSFLPIGCVTSTVRF